MHLLFLSSWSPFLSFLLTNTFPFSFNLSSPLYVSGIAALLRVKWLKKKKFFTKFMRKFFTDDSYWYTDSSQNTRCKRCTNWEAVNKVVKTISKDDHPGNSSNWFRWVCVTVSNDILWNDFLKVYRSIMPLLHTYKYSFFFLGFIKSVILIDKIIHIHIYKFSFLDDSSGGELCCYSIIPNNIT